MNIFVYNYLNKLILKSFSLFLAASQSNEGLDEYPEVPGIDSARDAMKNLPEEEKGKIAQIVKKLFLFMYIMHMYSQSAWSIC